MGTPLLKEELSVVNKIWSRDFIMVFLANFYCFFILSDDPLNSSTFCEIA